jgi:hypothetical protein
MKGRIAVREVLADFTELLAKALLSGIGVAVAMSLAIVALSSTAQAAEPGDSHALLFPTGIAGEYAIAPTADAAARGNPPGSAAPMPSPVVQAGVGALWASGRSAEPADEADPAATVQFLLGLFALLCAGMMSVLGRTACNLSRGALSLSHEES